MLKNTMIPSRYGVEINIGTYVPLRGFRFDETFHESLVKMVANMHLR